MGTFNERINATLSVGNIFLTLDENNNLTFDRTEVPEYHMVVNRDASYQYAECTNLVANFSDLMENNFSLNITTNMAYMFYNCHNLHGIPTFTGYNFIYNLSHAFTNCYNMNTIPQFHSYGNYISNVEDMSYAFHRSANNARILGLTWHSWIPDNCINAEHAFSYCNAIGEINITVNGIGRNCTSFISTYENCIYAQVYQNRVNELFNYMYKAEDISFMFRNCTNLRHFNAYLQSHRDAIQQMLQSDNVCNNLKKMEGTFYGCNRYDGPAILRINMHNTTQVGQYTTIGVNEYENSCAYAYAECVNITYSPIIIPDLVTNQLPTQLQGCFKNCVNMRGAFFGGNTTLINDDSMRNDNDINLYEAFSGVHDFAIIFDGSRRCNNYVDMIHNCTNINIWFNDEPEYQRFRDGVGSDFRLQEDNNYMDNLNVGYYNWFTNNWEYRNFPYRYWAKDLTNNIMVFVNAPVQPAPIGNVELNHFNFPTTINEVHFNRI